MDIAERNAEKETAAQLSQYCVLLWCIYRMAPKKLAATEPIHFSISM